MNKEACSGEKERLIDGVIRGHCFFAIMPWKFFVDFVDVASIKQLLVKLVSAVY